MVDGAHREHPGHPRTSGKPCFSKPGGNDVGSTGMLRLPVHDPAAGTTSPGCPGISGVPSLPSRFFPDQSHVSNTASSPFPKLIIPTLL